MAKIVVGRLKAKRKNTGNTAAKEKRVTGSEGRSKTLRTLDANSAVFGTDLQYVFGKNVARARRENKRKTGVVDFAVKG